MDLTMRQILHFTRWGLLCSPASLSAFQALLELQSVRLQLLSNLTRSLILLVVVWFYDKCNIQCNIFLPTGIGLSGLPPSIPHQICNGVLQVPFSLFAAFFLDKTSQQGIAGGTFLYITFFEVLPHELNIPSKRLWKVFTWHIIIVTDVLCSPIAFTSGIFCHLWLCCVLCHPHWTRACTWTWTCTSTPGIEGNVEGIQ